MSFREKSDLQTTDKYSDNEINDLAEWIEELTLKQAFFLKESYEGYLKAQALECQYVGGNAYVH